MILLTHPATVVAQAAGTVMTIRNIVPQDAPTIARFEVGQQYVTRFICDADAKLFVTVIKRTDKMVTVKDDEGHTYSRKVFEQYGREMFKRASYSMAPIFSADRKA